MMVRGTFGRMLECSPFRSTSTQEALNKSHKKSPPLSCYSSRHTLRWRGQLDMANSDHDQSTYLTVTISPWTIRHPHTWPKNAPSGTGWTLKDLPRLPALPRPDMLLVSRHSHLEVDSPPPQTVFQQFGDTELSLRRANMAATRSWPLPPPA